jgi:hypothetical protein
VQVKIGRVVSGHPYIEVLVSTDQKTSQKLEALVDTGFSGFLSVPVMTASLLGLKAHTTARYTLANGKLSDPIPLAYGFACLDSEDEKFVQGLFCLSENASAVVGVDFLLRCGKVMMLSPRGVVMVDEAQFVKAMQTAADLERKQQSPALPVPTPRPTQS